MDYVGVADARRRDGLRLVLTTGVPGPWGEAAKYVFQVKGLAFVPVAQEGGGENAELYDWTGQTSAPVAVWNDEEPCVTSREILLLAERLSPAPVLLPADSPTRSEVLGVCEEIHGPMGLGWCRRLMMFDQIIPNVDLESEAMAGMRRMARTYRYSPQAAREAEKRVISILEMLAGRVERSGAGAPGYLVGDGLSAADLYWAAFSAMLDPMPEDVNPMPDHMRAMYGGIPDSVRAVLTPRLIEHRDFVFREHLSLPLDY